MALSFPSSPTLNQLFSSGGQNWAYDGTKWKLVSMNAVYADSPPAGPANGMVWIDTTTMLEYTYYNSQWVQLPLGGSGSTIYQSVGVLGTTQATTSGTTVTFTGIPAGTKILNVLFNNVSTNGSSSPQLQFGSGSIQATGYNSYGWLQSFGSTISTTGFVFAANPNSNQTYHGYQTFMHMGSNIWITTGGLTNIYGSIQAQLGGSVALSGSLDRVQLSCVNGTDTFDSGSMNILYYS